MNLNHFQKSFNPSHRVCFASKLKSHSASDFITSSICGFDLFLKGGIPTKALTEFGMPLGQEARELLIPFILSVQSKGQYVLWICCHTDLKIYPPAWFARGVLPSKIIFAYSQNGAHELKKALIHPLFKLIIIDTSSHKEIGKSDLIFLRQQARINKQSVVIIRNYLLSNRLGNACARLRMNVTKESTGKGLVARVIRGRAPGAFHISEESLNQSTLISKSEPESTSYFKPIPYPALSKNNISFSNPSTLITNKKADHPFQFIAIRTSSPTDNQLQSLTNRVMKWSDSIWIFDLRAFLSFWEREAQRNQIPLISLWKKVLNSVFNTEDEESNTKLKNLMPPYSAACAENPWKAVLLLEAMKERNIKGLICLYSEFGKDLYRSISWNIYWRSLDELAIHSKTTKQSSFKPQEFNQQKSRFKRAIARLNLKTPDETLILNTLGIKKRFGSLIANSWSWTFSVNYKLTDSEFPWITAQFEEKPSVKRYLEYPVYLWEQIAPLLTEDLDSLNRLHKKRGHEKVVKIEWDITLDDETLLKVPINFRVPHDMKIEEKKHPTTLNIARDGFLQAFKEEIGEGHFQYFLSSWKLTLEKTLVVPEMFFDLFGNQSEKDTKKQLLKLQNELPILLHRFALSNDFIPEDSFIEVPITAPPDTTTEFSPSLLAIARTRPLFLYLSPYVVSKTHKFKNHLETVMSKWWINAKNRNERHYYKIVNDKGESVWAYKKKSEEWVYHGLFA